MVTQRISTQLRRDRLQDLVSLLSSVLTKNKNLEVSLNQIQDIWYDEKQFSPDVSLFDNLVAAFETPRRDLREFADMLETLQTMVTILQKATHSARTRLDTASLHEGINRLPDEVLSIILEHATSSFEDACVLSRVCTRFRSVILSSPRIWASCELTVHSTPRQVSTIVRLSKDMPLNARIDLGPYIPLNAPAILENASSIGELCVTDIGNPILRNYFAGMQLPRLQRLSMRWSEYAAAKQTGQPTPHVYDTWTMPQVQCLDANFIPHPAFGETIIQCRLDFDTSLMYVNELLGFLSSCPRLELLDVSFNGTSAWCETINDQDVDLPNLDSFSLRVSKTTSSLLNRFLGRLNCRNLSELSVAAEQTLIEEKQYDMAFEADAGHSVMSADHKECKERIAAVCRFIHRHQDLRKLSILMETEAPSCVVEQLEILFDPLPPSLETFVIAGNIILQWDRGREVGVKKPSSIDCLRIWGENSWEMDLISSLVRRGLIGANVPRRVALEHCSPTQVNELKAMYPFSEIGRRP